MPVVATKAMQLIKMGHSYVEDIAAIVSADPAIAARSIYHHSLLCAGHAEECQCRLTAVTSLGNQFCHRLGIGVRESRADLDLPAGRAAEAIGIAPDAGWRPASAPACPL
jgi:hypothetical protein